MPRAPVEASEDASGPGSEELLERGEKTVDLMAQIGKAARLLDLKDDTEGAIATLRGVIAHPESDLHLPIKLEAITFLADLYCHRGRYPEAREQIELARSIDLTGIEPDLVDHCIERLEKLEAITSAGGSEGSQEP